MSSKPTKPRTGYSPETLSGAGFPTIAYETLQLGDEFRSEDRVIRPGDVEAYAFAVEDYDPWFFAPGPFGAPIAHPTFLANQALMLRHNHYFVPAGLHARMIFEFVAPLRLGERARTVGSPVDKYLRRGKPYMVTEFHTDTEGGERLVEGKFVQMLFKNETAPEAGSGAPPEPTPPSFDPAVLSASGRTRTVENGQVLPRLSRTIDQRQIDIYSGVKPLSIHTDPKWARAKGFDQTIAQGMMSTAYVSTIMTTAFGEGFITGGRMDARFLRPVLCGDTLDVVGKVVGFTHDDGRLRSHVEVSAHNQRGEQTLAATASALCR